MSSRRKPISFDTTIRSPERIPQFISILSKFENQIIDDEVALKLEGERIKISDNGKLMIKTYEKGYPVEDEFDETYEQSAF